MDRYETYDEYGPCVQIYAPLLNNPNEMGQQSARTVGVECDASL